MARLPLPRTVRKTGPGPGRYITLYARPEAGAWGYLTITVGGDQWGYYVREVPTQFGVAAYLLEKADPGTDAEGERYAVHFYADGSATCECRGFLRWGHCKHTDGLAALRERKLL